MSARPLTARLSSMALLLLIGCGASDPAGLADQAQTSLNAGDYAATVKAADAGLAALDGTDPALGWRLERLRLDALAASGDGAATLAALKRLAEAYPKQVTADTYAKAGGALNDAGAHTEAIDVVEAGKARFPQQTAAYDKLIAAITKAVEEGGDSAAMNKLRQLGYLGG